MKRLVSVIFILLLSCTLVPGCSGAELTTTTPSGTELTATEAELPDGIDPGSSGAELITTTSSVTELTATEAKLAGGKGRLIISITDPPVPLENVEITFDTLEIHKAGGPWQEIEMETKTFELLDLDGVTALMADCIVDAGVYTQIRLNMATVNIWVTGDDTMHAAKVPSNTIKLVGSFKVVEGEEEGTEVTIDINGAQSVQTGNGNDKYIFRPAVKLLIPESAIPDEEDGEETITETTTAE